ncbi:MAG TPA: MbtH family NRPS accessory protein [Pseudonocardia sp.]|jgi:MbtH protein|nr:MbtH family NRPS accessory protein [Pseudonocardia sp.]
MSNPFEDSGRADLVLVNGQGLYSLWPADSAVPPGWRV